MDPDATLLIIEHYAGSDCGEQACKDLSEWIRNGGFQPDWAKRPDATHAYNLWRKRHGDG